MGPGVADLSPRARQLVGAARELLEEEGREALTMRRLAQRLGIQAPSIYKHLPDKDALEAGIISTAFDMLAVAIEAAVAGPRDSLEALALAYRAFALDRPHLYRLMTQGALRRDLLAPGTEERVVRRFSEATGNDRDRARAFWAFAHGATILELDHRFPADADLDATWKHGLDAFRAITGSANDPEAQPEHP